MRQGGGRRQENGEAWKVLHMGGLRALHKIRRGLWKEMPVESGCE
jgi:hypothetical protein